MPAKMPTIMPSTLKVVTMNVASTSERSSAVRSCGSAADGDEIRSLVLADRLDGRGAALGLADHRDEAGPCEHRPGELVHARRSGRAGGADHLIAHRIDRADVVDDAVREVDRQRLA